MLQHVIDQPKQKRIGVLMGGRSAERAISLQSGTAVFDALSARGYDAVSLDVGDRPCQQIADAGIDLAFVALHGRFGEDGCIQGLLESMAIPYTGAGVLASALAMDKVVSKRLFDAAGLPTPRWVYPATRDDAASLGLPLVLKPRGEGSSVGLHVVRTAEQLDELLGEAPPEPLLAEQYISGHELSVGVLGRGDQASVLGSVEIRPAGGLYDFEAKYEREDTQYLVPAPLEQSVASRLEQLALAAHRILECSGATRVDFRWDGDDGHDPQLLEVNTLPGLTSHSLLPKIAEHRGIDYGQLIERIAADAGLKA